MRAAVKVMVGAVRVGASADDYVAVVVVIVICVHVFVGALGGRHGVGLVEGVEEVARPGIVGCGRSGLLRLCDGIRDGLGVWLCVVGWSVWGPLLVCGWRGQRWLGSRTIFDAASLQGGG